MWAEVVRYILIALGLIAAIVAYSSHVSHSLQKPQQSQKKGEIMNGEKATFAGGCFWCVEVPFVKVDGYVQW